MKGTPEPQRALTPAWARDFVKRGKVVPFTCVPGARESFVHAITGETVKGSWWGHPLGKVIYNLAGASAGDAIHVKLLGGKTTIVHRSLVPALFRVATDEVWRNERKAELSPPARNLLKKIEAKGRARSDDLAKTKDERKALAKARLELERALLVDVREEHLEDSGRHTTEIGTWETFRADEVALAKKLDFDESLEKLRAACEPCVPACLTPPRRRRR